MSCEGKSDHDLHRMSDDALLGAWRHHMDEAQLVAKDRTLPLELAEKHEMRARQIEAIQIQRLPEIMRDALSRFRSQLHIWRGEIT